MRRLMAGMILLSAVSFLGLSPAHAGLVGIYWGDVSNLKAQRADLDISGVTDLVNDQIYLTTGGR
jgi:hypothetical protein